MATETYTVTVTDSDGTVKGEAIIELDTDFNFESVDINGSVTKDFQ